MKAIELQQQTKEFSGLIEVERERPDPDANEVLVRMHAWSPKTQDIAQVTPERRFGISEMVELPIVPLSDGAGEVVAVGENVSRLSEGDRIATRYAPNWVDGDGSLEDFAPLAGLLRPDARMTANGTIFHDGSVADETGTEIPGILAEYIALPADSLPLLPDNLSYEEGATLPGAGLTAWHALVENGGVRSDETVLVMGTGGVSTFALQFATLRGAETIVTSSSDAKLKRAQELGASETINYESTPEWGEIVYEQTDGGVDHVVEMGGVGTLPQSLRAAAVNGHVHVVGVDDKSGERGYDIHMNIHRPVFHKALKLEGIWAAGSREMFDRMNETIEAAGMTPEIDRRFDFAEVQKAYRYFHEEDHQGRIVITTE